MCGRYALAFMPSVVRRYLQEMDMPVYESPDDDETRQSYNVAPGYTELVYRADVPDWGAGTRRHAGGRPAEEQEDQEDQNGPSQEQGGEQETRYKLQAMRWGLIPFWTKRKPDYGSLMRTINCRDDSLLDGRGMWNTMKQRKRCIVLCQGFYEWLKKHGGKEKIPHFVKRKDGKIMCFAGLWDCAQYEGSDEKLYSYTIITTSPNKQLEFLHDRMPVILENGSEEMHTWLDPKRSTWSKELQDLLKPYQGELDVYPVSKDVGKVGNNSPTFIVPVASLDNKNNIANFFANAKPMTKGEAQGIKHMRDDVKIKGEQVEHMPGEHRETVDGNHNTEDNAPLSKSDADADEDLPMKREHEEESNDDATTQDRPAKIPKSTHHGTSADTSPSKQASTSARKSRSATSNVTKKSPMKGSPTKAEGGNQRITRFFGK